MLSQLLIAVFLTAGVQALTSDNLPPIPEDGDLWVVLVAGSNGWMNYRHQADVCHAYQIVSAHGVPDDHIIVMMYDDIARNPRNPTPGVIINHPNGTDVYKGVPKDYVCADVNPMVFLQVLKGEKTNTGTGKTLMSTEKDHVFVYFADHGAKGLVAFGENTLKATELNQAIKYMHENKMYAKLVVYIEACESGSMFKGLLDDSLAAFATTASNATTSSFACYYDPKRETFLGDVYSIKWLEDSDKEDIEKETLEQQYKIVKKETNTSMVCQFGDMSISKMTVGSFQGEKAAESTRPPVPPQWLSCGKTAVAGPQVPIAIQQNIIKFSNDPKEQEAARAEIQALMKNRQFMEEKTKSIVSTVLGTDDVDSINNMLHNNIELERFDCYYAAVDAYHEHCFNVGRNDYALRQLNTFVNLCHANIAQQTIVDAILMTCDHPSVYGIH